MKKLICSLTAAILTAALLAGCSDNSGDKSESLENSPDGQYYNEAAEDDYIGVNRAPGIVFSDEEYSVIAENREIDVADNSVITFSLKIDTASYRNVARYIEGGNLPPSDAVRIEEMINYFNYDAVLPENETPFSIYTELGRSPFNQNNHLAFIRVKSKEIDKTELPKSNLVFLIDSSGSMASHDKLPLLKSAFGMLADTLTEDDLVSVVTYAGESRVVLDGVSGNQKDRIMAEINELTAGGSTAGGAGIAAAYELAEKNFIQNGNNRVILATDGDFNVGVSTVGELERLMAEKSGDGVYITILGVGTENLKDNKMEVIAKNGKGNYHYLDSAAAAQKVLIDELSANLFSVADDVKSQIEFNPALVGAYRLIGYENRMLTSRDFKDDSVGAGVIGIGTDVILMFELELKDGADLKYQPSQNISPDDGAKYSDELFEIRIRYKNPGESESLLLTHPVKTDRILDFNSSDFIFAASVAGFGKLLRSSEYTGSFTIDKALALALDSTGQDRNGYRREFIELLQKYKRMS